MERLMLLATLALCPYVTFAQKGNARNMLATFGPAPAPGPNSAAQSPSSGVFIFTASTVTFANSTTLNFEGVPNVTQWIAFPPNPSAGIFAKARFFSKALAGANEDWIGGPQALLKGMSQNGTSSSVILTLHAPMYTPGTVTVAYKLLPDREASLPASGGVANAALQAVSSASLGSSGSSDLVSAVPASTTLYNATVFIDVVAIKDYTSPGSAAEKFGLINIPLSGGWGPYSDDYYGGGGDYYGYYNGR